MKRILDWLISRHQTAAADTKTSTGLLVLRLWVGLIMAFGHGWGKLASFGERAAQFPDPLGVGSPISLGLTVFAEFFCALALALGLLTRAAAIPLIITMLTAAFLIHGDDPFGKKELALLFLAPFVAILIAGPGRFSIDHLLSGRALR